MKKLTSIFIIILSCTSQITFASNSSQRSVQTPSLQDKLAIMPAMKIPFKKSSPPSKDEIFYKTVINTYNFDHAICSGIIESREKAENKHGRITLKEMLAVEKYRHDFQIDHSPNVPHTLFRSSLINTAPINPYFPDRHVSSPLEMSITANQHKMSLFLISEGANVNYKGRILNECVGRLCGDYSYHAHRSNAFNATIKYINILLRANVDCNLQHNGVSPLHQIVKTMPTMYNYFEYSEPIPHKKVKCHLALKAQVVLMKQFLAAGGNPYLRDTNGKTVFEVANHSARSYRNNILKDSLQEAVSAQLNLPELHQAARAQLTSDEYRPILLTQIHSRIYGKHAQSLTKQGRDNELQAYCTNLQEIDDKMPKDLRLAYGQELSKKSHAMLTNS